MKERVAIVIPVYKQFSDLENFEKISLEQIFRTLYNYDICFITHRGIDTTAYSVNKSLEINIKHFLFDKTFFADIPGYNRLLLNYDFYQTFKSYSHILICQLDVFVFSDMIEYFLKLDYDYIGAPWFEGFNNASKTNKIIGAGNGGFSLRKVESFLKVLALTNLFKFPFIHIEGLKEAILKPIYFLKIFKHNYFLKKRTYMPILPWQFPQNEDFFWGIYVKQIFTWFKVAEINDAIAFSFEVNPDILFDLNNKQLPMATHAWQKYDPGFWMPHIEKFGYSFDEGLN